MRVLGVIPTANRTTAPSVANSIAPICDSVFILAKKCQLPKGDYSIIYRDGTEWEPMNMARQLAVELAIKNDYDYVFIADDDIKPNAKLLQCMLYTMTEEPRLGAICSPSTVLYHWSKTITTSHNWLISPDLSQLSLLRVKLIRELEPVYAREVETLNDRVLALRLWDIGIPVVRLHNGLTHNILISRTDRKSVV